VAVIQLSRREIEPIERERRGRVVIESEIDIGILARRAARA
jgi:hypothetical protein